MQAHIMTPGPELVMVPTIGVKSILKRDGKTLQPFDESKVRRAISRAWQEAEGAVNEKAVNKVVNAATGALPADVVGVEKVQDAVGFALMKGGHFKVAEAFICFRERRTLARESRTTKSPDPKAISGYIHASKYARYVAEYFRREVYEETVSRVEGMHLGQYPQMADDIKRAFDLVREKRVLPSMRSMQFGGAAVLANNNRLYNCMGVETEFITTQGVKKFSDFKDGDKITVLTHTGAWKSAVVKSYGTQQLFEVTIGRGRSAYTVRATRDHQWVLQDGQRTNDLSVKHKLAKAPRLVGAWDYQDANPEARYYWALGYVYGDGTLVKGREGEYQYSMVRLCGADKERFLERFKELGFATSAPASFGGDAIAYTGKYLKTLPSIEKDGFENVMAFVRGYLDADGHKNENGDWPSPFNGIQATGGEAIDFIRSVFPAVGAYITREDDLTGQETNFGVRPETSRFGLVLGFGDAPSSPYSVQGIKEAGHETVWCLEVEDDHSFVLPNGIVTGNCSFSLVDRPEVFAEALFLLLSGCGVGYSVQFDHVDKLPVLNFINPKKVRHHVVEDTIEGWADALRALVQSYLDGVYLEFSYFKVRDAGSPLKTSGGRAPGHLKLKEALESIRAVLSVAQGRKLRPIECHRIMCHAADAVLSGGIRRSAMIALFSLDDSEMIYAKTGNWFEKEPWFANANNSVVLKRDEVRKKQFKRIFQMTKQWGEPGFYFTNDFDYGTNPCGEIGLNPKLTITEALMQKLAEKGIDAPVGSEYTGWAFCNLCELNAAMFETYEDFEKAAWAATLIGTLQAGYTKMPYLGWVSEALAEREALLGIGMTGMLDSPQIACKPEYQREMAHKIKGWNAEFAARVGIKPAARLTCVKPSGCRPWDALTTTDKGILTLEEMFWHHPSGETWADQPEGISALQEGGSSPITRSFDNGEAEVLEIEMNYGLVVRSTPNHPWFVKYHHSHDGGSKRTPVDAWVPANKIRAGDVLEVASGVYRSETPWKFTGVNVRALTMRSATQIIRQPSEMDDDLAWFIGYTWGDGAQSLGKYRLRFTDGNRTTLIKAQRILWEKFGLEATVHELSDRDAASMEIGSKHLWLWMVRNGIEKYAEETTLERIPRCVRSSSWRHIISFAAGLLDSDGCLNQTKTGARPQVSSASDDFSRHFQQVMWAVGLGFGRSLQSQGKSFQAERHLYHLSLSASPTDPVAFDHLIRHSVKCHDFSQGTEGKKWQMDNDTTRGRQIPGKVREVRSLGKMPTFDVEVAETHWFYDGAVKSHNTTSLALGSVGSGIHPHHARRYIRRVTADELELPFQAFKAANPHMCVRKPDGKYVIEFPVQAPPGATIKADLTAVEFLDLVKSTQQNWVLPGTAVEEHSPGLNHNVSNTVTVKESEWDKVADYLWEHRDFFTGVSLLASTGDKDYAFAPNEEVVTPADEARWNNLIDNYTPVDYELLMESDDSTALSGEVACAGGACLVP